MSQDSEESRKRQFFETLEERHGGPIDYAALALSDSHSHTQRDTHTDSHTQRESSTHTDTSFTYNTNNREPQTGYIPDVSRPSTAVLEEALDAAFDGISHSVGRSHSSTYTHTTPNRNSHSAESLSHSESVTAARRSDHSVSPEVVMSSLSVDSVDAEALEDVERILGQYTFPSVHNPSPSMYQPLTHDWGPNEAFDAQCTHSQDDFEEISYSQDDFEAQTHSRESLNALTRPLAVSQLADESEISLHSSPVEVDMNTAKGTAAVMRVRDVPPPVFVGDTPPFGESPPEKVCEWMSE